jgi:hypothetical protein
VEWFEERFLSSTLTTTARTIQVGGSRKAPPNLFSQSRVARARNFTIVFSPIENPARLKQLV